MAWILLLFWFGPCFGRTLSDRKLGWGPGWCAEVAAIAQMLTRRQTQIDTVVALTKGRILPPCGRCRETMA